MSLKSRILPAVAVAGLLAGLTACGQGVESAGSSSGAASSSSPTIGVLFPDNKTPLWENRLWPGVRDELKKECPDCQVIYANVAGDPTEQQNKADAMLAQGIKALVFAPVDADSSKAIVAKADAQKVPVIGFGSVPEGDAAAFVGVDVVELGRLQGSALLEALKAGGDPKRGCLVALDGDAQTPGTQEYLQGRKETLDPNVNICKESNIPNWDPATAQTVMDQAITAVGKDQIVGVYSMNDGIASGASAAMKAAGYTVPFPPLSGGDTDLAAVQRILAGEQAATVNARVKDWGQTAAPVALKAARGEALTSDKTIKNASEEMPWFTTPTPDAVTLANIQTSVIDGGLYTYDEICTDAYKSACDTAGLKAAS